MKKRLSILLIIVICVMMVGVSLSGCKSKSAEDKGSPQYGASPSTTTYAGDSDNSGIEKDYTGNTQNSSYSDILNERKIIFKANVTIEVENMSETLGKIDTIINGIGFVSSSNITKDKVKYNGNEVYVSNGVVVIRVVKEKFESVMGNIAGLGNVIDSQKFSDDVSGQYFDTESRLKILRIEEDRLLSYLETIQDPDTIFKYEARLTEVRTQIESLTGTLRKWDDLVDLSTITINIREVLPKEVEEEDPEGFLARLWKGFVNSVKSVVKFLGEFAIALAKALPVLIVLGVVGIIVLICMGWPKRFRKGGKNGKNV